MRRKLRIAFSVVCGILCLLLIVLCVRSYFRIDLAHCPLLPPKTLIVESTEGTIVVCVVEPAPGTTGFSFGGWGIASLRSTNRIPIPGTPSWGVAVYQYDAAVKFPHWFAIIISGISAAMPWLRWRFSLRTLLITTTLVAVLLGAIVYAVR
jgi:hypothetical protein